MEERENESRVKANTLQNLYRQDFHRIQFTIHPQIVGEAPGKSSNQSWAAKQIIEDYVDVPPKERREVLVTTMDGACNSRIRDREDSLTVSSRHSSLVAVLCSDGCRALRHGLRRRPPPDLLRPASCF